MSDFHLPEPRMIIVLWGSSNGVFRFQKNREYANPNKGIETTAAITLVSVTILKSISKKRKKIESRRESSPVDDEAVAFLPVLRQKSAAPAAEVHGEKS